MTTAAPTSGGDPAAQLPKVLIILRRILEYPNGAGLSELSRELGLPKSSVHRSLTALKAAEFVAQDKAGRYRIHLSLVQAAYSAHDGMDEVGLVRPVLEDIASEFGETAHFGVRDGGHVVYLAKVNPPNQRVQMSSMIGGRNPLYCTGVGKALLAYEEQVHVVLEPFLTGRSRLPARTENTITELSALRDELALTRERGFAVDREENEVGICCVAIPIFFGSAARPGGAISVTALMMRTPLDVLIRRAADLRDLVERGLPGVRVGVGDGGGIANGSLR